MHPRSLLSSISWPSAIIHLDGDAFFASCEQAVHPEYRGKPLITGQERNIVASMSYEAKALGIRRGTALWEARKIYPEVIIVPSDYETYSLISKRMFSIMRRFSPEVEESSIDEGYMDITGLTRLYRTGYPEIASRVRETVEQELGISISAGLGVTKTLAKLAAKFKKPRGFTAVPQDGTEAFLARIRVQEVSGIGRNTASFLQKNGIVTALDYVRKPESWIRTALGKTGMELWLELQGRRVYALDTAAKTAYASISKSKTFTPPSDDYTYVKAQLYRNCESAFIKLRRYKLRTKSMVVFLRRQNFEDGLIEGHFIRPTSCFIEVFPLIESLFQRLFRPGILYRQTGIVLCELCEDHHIQLELFEDSLKILKMRRLAGNIDEINRRYGKHTVGSGMKLYIDGKGRDPLRGAKDQSIIRGGTLQTIQHLRGVERWELPQRKKKLLPGENRRQRLAIPILGIKI